MEDFEREFEEIQERTDKWLDLFFESKYFKGLNEIAKDNAGFAIGVFTDYMFNYEGQGPEEWDICSLETCCLDTLPRKVTADEDFSKVLAKILEAYFLFLDENKFIENGKVLAKKVIKLQPEITEAFDDPSKWGMAKSFMMGAAGNGVDIADQNDLNRYMTAYNTNLVGQMNTNALPGPKIGRNDPCPCGSGKKYKKCCGK